MFVNGILTNIDVWHDVKKSDIYELEELDRSLLNKMRKVPFSTPNESLYLKLGILPIGTIIKARRISHLHYLVNLDKNEMLYKFYRTQWLNPTRGDWSLHVKEDLADFAIKMEPEDIERCQNNPLK